MSFSDEKKIFVVYFKAEKSLCCWISDFCFILMREH